MILAQIALCKKTNFRLSNGVAIFYGGKRNLGLQFVEKRTNSAKQERLEYQAAKLEVFYNCGVHVAYDFVRKLVSKVSN